MAPAINSRSALDLDLFSSQSAPVSDIDGQVDIIQTQVDDRILIESLKRDFCDKNSLFGEVKDTRLQCPKVEQIKREHNNISCSAGASHLQTTAPKRVQWNNKQSEITVLVEHQYDIFRELLLSISSLCSAAAQAILFMLEDDDSEDIHTIVKMAENALTVKLNHPPKSSELFELVEECQYNEKDIVTKFFDICLTEEGAANLKSLIQNSVEDDWSSEETQKELQQSELLHNDSESTLNTGSTNSEQSQLELNENSQSHEHLSLEMSTTTAVNEHLIVSNDQLPETVMVPEEPHKEFEDEESKPVEKETAAEQVKKSTVTHEQSVHIAVTMLRKEQEYLRNPLKCMSCQDRPIEVTILPCGHFVLCSVCSDSHSVCPVCEKIVLAEVKTFLG